MNKPDAEALADRLNAKRFPGIRYEVQAGTANNSRTGGYYTRRVRINPRACAPTTTGAPAPVPGEQLSLG